MRRILILAAILAVSLASNAQQTTRLWVGTYTNSCESEGIYAYDFNLETGKATPVMQTQGIENPSYICVSADGSKLWSVNESGDKSRVSAFTVDEKKKKIRFLNTEDAKGADPCFLTHDANNLIVSNYSGGSISVFKTGADGSLSPAAQVIAHEGHSLTQRQKSPHVHQSQLTPDKKFVVANDLGTDRIYVYRYYPDSTTKILEFQDSVAVKTASGPRHLTFSPNGQFAYLLQELDGTLTAYRYHEGKLNRLQETTVVQPGFKGDISAADIHFSPDGRFLYATNRGDANTISVFNVSTNGRLYPLETIATGGKGPRNFTISPDGKYLLVGHQYTNEVVIFQRDVATGKLSDTGNRIALCAPVCLVFPQTK